MLHSNVGFFAAALPCWTQLTHCAALTAFCAGSDRSDAQVVGALARALGQPWQQYAERLLEPMALTGLSEELVDAMCQVCDC